LSRIAEAGFVDSSIRPQDTCDSLPLKPPMFRRHWEAAATFLLLLVLMSNPLVLHLWNTVEDKQDSLLNTWIIAWVGHALVTDPLHLYNSNIFFPYPNTLAFSEILLPQGLLALPISLATDNTIFGYNMVLVAMLFLDAFAMYLLVLDWTHSRAAGSIAGIVYAFNPFNLGNFAQIQLLSLGWLPLAIMYLRRMPIGGKGSSGRRQVVQSSLIFSLFFVLQSLSSFYFAVLTVFSVLLYLGWQMVARLVEASHLGKSASIFGLGAASRLKVTILALVLSSMLIGIVLIPLVLPYLTVERELGFQRSVQDSEPFSANLKEFTEVSPQNVIYGGFLAPNPVRYNGGYPLDNLFPGLAALVLAGVGLGASKSDDKWFLLLLAMTAFILALGPRLYITADSPTEITLPYRLLYDSLPFMRALRAPVRFDALVMFGVAGLGGFGIAAIGGRNRHKLVALSSAALISLEYLAFPAVSTVKLPVGSEVPSVYRWLAQQPASVALDLPMMGPDAQNQLDISDQYFTTYDWQKTPDGYSGFNPPARGEIAFEMQYFPNARSISLLQSLGVDYVVVHRDMLRLQNAAAMDAIKQVAALEHVQDFGEVSLYRVVQARSDASELSERLYLPQPAPAGGSYTAYLIVVNQSTTPFAVKPTDRLDLTARWSSGRVESVSIPIRLVTSKASVVLIPLTAPNRSGIFSLQFEAAESLIGPVSLGGNVQVGEESAQETVIPASLGLEQPLLGEYSRGSAVKVKIDWLPLNKIDAYYSFSARVVDGEGRKVAQIDRQPAVPTLLWVPDVAVPDTLSLPVPVDLAPGSYRVELLMYDAHLGTSVLMLDKSMIPQERFTLGEFRVK
jgi:hypothetical protein